MQTSFASLRLQLLPVLFGHGQLGALNQFPVSHPLLRLENDSIFCDVTSCRCSAVRKKHTQMFQETWKIHRTASRQKNIVSMHTTNQRTSQSGGNLFGYSNFQQQNRFRILCTYNIWISRNRRQPQKPNTNTPPLTFMATSDFPQETAKSRPTDRELFLFQHQKYSIQQHQGKNSSLLKYERQAA